MLWGDRWSGPPAHSSPPGLSPASALQVTVLRGENATAKSLHSVVQTLESDKVKLELKVKNLELQLKENKRQLSSSSGKGTPARPPGAPLVTGVTTHVRQYVTAATKQANHEASKCKASKRTEITSVGDAGVQP